MTDAVRSTCWRGRSGYRHYRDSREDRRNSYQYLIAYQYRLAMGKAMALTIGEVAIGLYMALEQG